MYSDHPTAVAADFLFGRMRTPADRAVPLPMETDRRFSSRFDIDSGTMPLDQPNDVHEGDPRRRSADRLELTGLPPIERPLPTARPLDAASAEFDGARSKFLSIWYRCCHVYGRLYKNADATHYEGQCPRCGASLDVPIGEGGTSRRMFEAG